MLKRSIMFCSFVVLTGAGGSGSANASGAVLEATDEVVGVLPVSIDD